METFHTFADGALTYDCAACGQACCRGHGIAAGPELIPLLARAPALGAHVALRPGGSFAVANVTDGCWSLGSDGWCEIEREAGRALKPVTCRLFPFNHVYRVGEVRVVDFNSLLCPLRPAEGGEGVRHAELDAEIESLAGSPLIDLPPPLPPGLATDWLDRERAAAEAARLHAGDADALAAAMKVEGSADRARRWAALYGLEETDRVQAEAAVAPRVALLVPSLRFTALFSRETRDYASVESALPARLRALVFLGALATRSARGTIPSLRALTHLWRSQSQLLDALVGWDDKVTLRSPRFDADVPEALRGSLALLLGLAFRAAGKSFGDLVEQVAAQVPPEQRPLIVALAASQRETLVGAA